jgi:uncharacterized iron-regulated membrane protein
MRVPPWLTLGAAILVMFFGGYRIWLALRPKREEAEAPPRRGLFGLARRTQFLVGVIYLLLGGALIATTYGWNPLGDAFGTKPAPQKPGVLLEKRPAPTGSAAPAP